MKSILVKVDNVHLQDLETSPLPKMRVLLTRNSDGEEEELIASVCVYCESVEAILVDQKQVQCFHSGPADCSLSSVLVLPMLCPYYRQSGLFLSQHRPYLSGTVADDQWQHQADFQSAQCKQTGYEPWETDLLATLWWAHLECWALCAYLQLSSQDHHACISEARSPA